MSETVGEGDDDMEGDLGNEEMFKEMMKKL